MSVPRTSYSGRLMSEHYYFTIPELEQMDDMASEVKMMMNKTMSHEAEASTDMSTPFDDQSEEKRRWQEYWSCEQSIIGARASVMVYDDMNKKWIPSGSSSGLSKVQIYHHQQNNTFRVVGRKLQDHEVVINCSILKGLKYNQATTTFHQWRDSKFVYGLNFSSQQDAEAFARAMMHALEVLSGRVIPTTAPPLPGVNSTAYEEDMGYRTMTREDAAIIQQQQQIVGQQGVAPSPQTPTTQIPQSPPTPQGHHRTSSAPPAPQPPPMAIAPQNYAQNVHQQQQQQQVSQASQQMITGQGYQQQMSGYSGQAVQNSYGSVSSVNQQFNQQPIYVSSSGSQPPPQQIHHIQQQHSQNGPIYVSSQGVPVPPPSLPTSASTSNVYGQQSMGAGGYGQSNGQVSAAAPVGGGQVPIPPQMPPQAPPMPPSFGGGGSGAPQPPAAPPAPGPPPPPPPPTHGGAKGGSDGPPGGGMDMSTLAAQLQNARLRRNQKTTPPPAENSGSSTSSGSSGNYGTIGRTTTGMASMMDEMAKTLARRRAQAERKEPDSDDLNSSRRPWEKSNTLPHKLGGNASSGGGSASSPGATGGTIVGGGPESPRPQRKRFGSASEETILKQVNGDGLSLPLTAELDNIKAEILREMRIEISKAKQEIIEVIKSEFNRR